MKNPNYLGNPLLKATNVAMTYTQEQIEEYLKCAEDPIYFIENYIKIVHPDKGLVPFKMYEFQKNIVRTLHENRFSICKIPRQSGKSTTVTSWLLHCSLFNPNSSACILANKADTAKNLLDIYKRGYENLPKWLQQGIVEWNKFSVQLENGAKVVSASTSSSAIRGQTFSTVVIDEFGFIPANIAEQFFRSVYPTISAGNTTKMAIISTPNGLNAFYKMWKDAKDGKNSFVPVEAFWYDVPGRDEAFKKMTIQNTSEAQWSQEYETNFIGSDNTLISPSALNRLTYDTPISSSLDGLDIYEQPKKDSAYVQCVDTSHGVGLDYHACTVIDVTTFPYKLVAKFRNNTISYDVLPHTINKIGKLYNDALTLVELNDLGQAVSDILHQELEYPNLVSITIRGNKGQKADTGFAGQGKSQLGIRTSPQTKKTGCLRIKELIESDKLLVRDFDIVSELSTFIIERSKSSCAYKASEGYNDDLVSSLVSFGWLTTQSYFNDYTNIDLRKRMYAEQIQKIESEVIPFGFIDNGSSEYDEDVLTLSQENLKTSPPEQNIKNLPEFEGNI